MAMATIPNAPFAEPFGLAGVAGRVTVLLLSEDAIIVLVE